jgi:hypothetical protein
MLAHIGDAGFQVLASLFNFSWYHGILPRSWKEANVIAIYKGAASRSQASSFRPVSITSIIVRTFEHLIHKRLSRLLEASKWFHSLQFGFRAGRSPLDAIHLLISHVRNAFALNRDLPIAFLDIKKAFDRVWHPYLLRQLHLAGITGRAWKWIHAFLFDRTIRVIDRSSSSSLKPFALGVPQGAVLSPLLFCVFINSIAMSISVRCPSMSLILFADDISIAPNVNRVRAVARTHARQNVIIRAEMQLSLNMFSDWCSVSRMQFGSEKSKLLMFSRSRGIPGSQRMFSGLRLNGFTLEMVSEYLYLGLWLQRDLSWSKQEQYTLAKARKDNYFITRVINREGAPHFPAIRSLCVGYQRPRCAYALELWQPSEKCLRAMQSLIVHPLQKVLRLPRFSHHVGALVDSNCPSMLAFRQQQLLRFYARATQGLPVDHPTYIAVQADLNRFRLHKAVNFSPNCGLPTTWEALLVQQDWCYRALEMNALLSPCPPVVARVQAVLLQHMSSSILSPVLPHELVHLSRKDIDELTMPMTHLEWRTDPSHDSIAPLKLVKTCPGRSRYLYDTVNPITSMLARLRHNRVYTEQARHRFKDKTISPRCTWASCQQRELIRIPLDDVPHILLACPRHDTSRDRLIRALYDIDPLHFSLSRLTLAVVLGDLYRTAELSRSPRCQRAYVALRDFFYHVTIERGAVTGTGLRLLFG